MPLQRLPHHAYAVLVLLLILAALLTGAALGRLLLPPGHLGRGPEVSIPGAGVQAVAAAARSFPPARLMEQITTGPGQIGGDLSSGTPFHFSPRPRTGTPTWGLRSVPRGTSLERTHDWRLELQVGPTWQYAAGAGSRKLRAPDSDPIGEPQ